MNNLNIYEINPEYISYISRYDKHIFHNKKNDQQNNRKYIGVILSINNISYFAPLSSFKPKHKHMEDNLGFIKIKNYAVINLINMFPVPDGEYKYVDFSKEPNLNYKSLLISEYRFIKSIQDKIRKNALSLYNYKTQNNNKIKYIKYCSDFQTLEQACTNYKNFKK